MSSTEWRKCSTCKKPIGFNQKYYVCSVSTCNGQRTGYSFCSVSCWDAHVPGARHRDAAAIDQRSPDAGASVSAAPTVATAAPHSAPVRRIISSPAKTAVPASTGSGTANLSSALAPKEILIVASKLKDYIRHRSEMNTSAAVMEVLSDIVRRLCDEAIESARREGRKTVLDRDFKKGPGR